MRWESSGRPAGIVQISHGLGEHMGRYIGTAESLVAAGLVVYGHDYRGHGRTALSQESFGDFGPGGFDLQVEDVVRLSRIARCEQPGIPLILLGHSMGSFAAQQYVQDHSDLIDGLALSGSGILDGLGRLAHARNRTPAEVVNAAFGPARTPADWLSRDPAVVDRYLSDPLCFGWLQPAANESFFSSAPRLADPARLREIRHDLPIYVFSCGQDPVGQQLKGVSALIGRYRQAGIWNVSYDFYPAGGTRCSTKLTGMRSARICFGGFGAFSRQTPAANSACASSVCRRSKGSRGHGRIRSPRFPTPA